MVPVDAILVGLDPDRAFIQKIIEVGERFARRHDQVVLVDLALEKNREHIDCPARFPAEGL